MNRRRKSKPKTARRTSTKPSTPQETGRNAQQSSADSPKDSPQNAGINETQRPPDSAAMPDELRSLIGHIARGLEWSLGTEVFTHSEDYRSVTVRDKPFSLTARQAQMIEILHEAQKSGNPDVGIPTILERLETPNSRWQDTFKGNLKARKALIKTGNRKGTLRLSM